MSLCLCVCVCVCVSLLLLGDSPFGRSPSPACAVLVITPPQFRGCALGRTHFLRIYRGDGKLGEYLPTGSCTPVGTPQGSFLCVCVCVSLSLSLCVCVCVTGLRPLCNCMCLRASARVPAPLCACVRVCLSIATSHPRILRLCLSHPNWQIKPEQRVNRKSDSKPHNSRIPDILTAATLLLRLTCFFLGKQLLRQTGSTPVGNQSLCSVAVSMGGGLWNYKTWHYADTQQLTLPSRIIHDATASLFSTRYVANRLTIFRSRFRSPPLLTQICHPEFYQAKPGPQLPVSVCLSLCACAWSIRMPRPSHNARN